MQRPPSKDDFVNCPYNSSHRLLRKRLPMHLQKCRLNYPNQKLETCPFNITHVMDTIKMKLHINVCESRPPAEKCEDQVDTMDKGDTCAKPKLPQLPIIECSENWDDEPDVGTYNPAEYCSKNLIVRNLQGVPPSVRRQFRERERLRFIGVQCDKN